MRKIKRTGIAILIIMVVAGASLTIYLVYRSSVTDAKKLQADINQDGITNETDYNLFMNKFGQSCIGCAEDVNSDSLIDGKDMLILLSELNESKSAQ
jgi:hypothetical protein